MKHECEAGRRWYADTAHGSNYQQVLAFDTDASASDVSVVDRSLTDFVSPFRSGSATDVVNAVVREVDSGVESWPWTRCLRFAAGLQREARQHPDA